MLNIHAVAIRSATSRSSRRLSGLLAAVAVTYCLASLPAIAASTFVDGIKTVNDVTVNHENDSSAAGDPVHVILPGSALGAGSLVQSAASLAPGVADDGVRLGPLSLKSYAALGATAATTDRIWVRSQSRFDTPFEIVAAGVQSISVDWNGLLHFSGDAYAQYSLRIGFNPWNGIYDLLNEGDVVSPGAPGTSGPNDTIVDESRILTVDIPVEDIGKTYNLQVYLWTAAGHEYGGSGETLGAYADFYDTFSVTGWSDGLVSRDGLTPIPVPAAAWLLLSACALLRRRNNG